MHCPLEGRKYEPLFILNGVLKDVLPIVDMNRVCTALTFEAALHEVVYDLLNLYFLFVL